MTIRRAGDDHLDIDPGDGTVVAFSLDEIGSLAGRTKRSFGSSDGDAVPVSALLDRVDPASGVDHVTVSSGDGHYRASIPLDQLRAGGWMFVEGPLRLVVDDGRTLCWNVKQVVSLRFTSGPESDSVSKNPSH